MTRTSLAAVSCSIARATDLFGDAWTALIMRDVLAGVDTFDDIAADLCLSRKVLSARLSRLVDEGVLTRERYAQRPPRHRYRPTDKGRELYPVLLALMRWGDRWYSGEDGVPVRIRHRDCGADTVPVCACAHCGGELTPDTTDHLPGPGGRLGPGTAVIGRRIAAAPHS
jgi:DNA-binding HxlR family transcriptional regulator